MIKFRMVGNLLCEIVLAEKKGFTRNLSVHIFQAIKQVLQEEDKSIEKMNQYSDQNSEKNKRERGDEKIETGDSKGWKAALDKT